jgi:hypothetical protein
MTLRRRDVGKVRRASWWEGRMSAADTPGKRAALAWDWLRARVRRLPTESQAVMWAEITAHLDRLCPDDGTPKIRKEGRVG